jgi:hypothetical protein
LCANTATMSIAYLKKHTYIRRNNIVR